VSAAEAAEQSRIATAQGMRDIAAAMAEREVLPVLNESDDDISISSSDRSDKRRKLRYRKKPETRNSAASEAEKQAHYLKLELANAKVDIDDLKQELTSLKSGLNPYTSYNNEMASLKSAIDRSYKDVHTLTFVQLEKRFALFKEEYQEHLALCNAALAKVSLAEVKVSLIRVLSAEKRRAAAAEKKLEWAIWIRATTFNAAVGGLMALLICAFCFIIYWYVISRWIN